MSGSSKRNPLRYVKARKGWLILWCQCSFARLHCFGIVHCFVLFVCLFFCTLLMPSFKLDLNIDILLKILPTCRKVLGIEEWRLFLIWFKTFNLSKDKDKTSKATCFENKLNHKCWSRKQLCEKKTNTKTSKSIPSENLNNYKTNIGDRETRMFVRKTQELFLEFFRPVVSLKLEVAPQRVREKL